MVLERIGRYRIDRELGRGAMGRVFLAFDPRIERPVAIKTIQIFAALPESERDEARARFLREARSAGGLVHPGIVTVFDVGESDGIPYLAMEFVDGTPFDAYCREETLLPVPQVVALVAACAEALAFAHARGVEHRDVKPGNLMRVGEASVKVMDFGLAQTAATPLSVDGAVTGTPSTMSPEQIRGEAIDGRSDLFSLAVVLYEMLTGRSPFPGDSVSSVLYRVVHEPPVDPSDRPDRVPPPLAAFLLKALDKRPEARFADGTAFAAALRRAEGAAPRAPAAVSVPAIPRRLAEPGRQDPPHATGRPERPRPGRRLLPLVLVAALAAGFFALRDPIRRAITPPVSCRVRVDPPGILVLLDGRPLDGDVVSFRRDGPFGVLTATAGCRSASHRLEPGDAGGEVVLALDPAQAEVPVDSGTIAATVSLNGAASRKTPAALELDLCRENTVELRAEGYQPARAVVPPGATPLAARNAITALALAPLPTGRIVWQPSRYPVRYAVDGKPIPAKSAGLDVPAGSHEVRVSNEALFVDVIATIDVPAGGSATAPSAPAELAALTVQTFPPDAAVELARSGAPFRPIGETPLSVKVGPGSYTLRVRDASTGTTRDQNISLKPGSNPPFRVSLGREGR